MRKLLLTASFSGIAAAILVAMILASILTGCAGAGKPGNGLLGELNPGDSPAPAAAPRLAADTLLCIGSDLNDAQVLAWLASNGYLEGEPWNKLFLEPPMTGPRAGVDTTRYVDFFRSMCLRTVSAWDSSACRFLPFSEWPPDSQAAFAGREWRCGVFNLCDEVPCECFGTRWTFEVEGG